MIRPRKALEQLPLSLHRSFSLILELDQQVQSMSFLLYIYGVQILALDPANNSVLLSTMRKYLLQRKRLAGLPLSDETPVEPGKQAYFAYWVLGFTSFQLARYFHNQ